MLRQREDMEVRLKRIRAKEKLQREKYLKDNQGYSKKRKIDPAKAEDEGTDDQFILEDYDSDKEQSTSTTGGLSAATLELMQKLGMSMDTPKDDDDEAKDETKVGFKSLFRPCD